MFEELQRLYDAFLIYREGGIPALSKSTFDLSNKKNISMYKVKQSKLQLDYWAEDKAIKMEGESISKDYTRMQDEIG